MSVFLNFFVIQDQNLMIKNKYLERIDILNNMLIIKE